MSDPAENRDVRGNTIKPHSVEAESVNTEKGPSEVLRVKATATDAQDRIQNAPANSEVEVYGGAYDPGSRTAIPKDVSVTFLNSAQFEPSADYEGFFVDHGSRLHIRADTTKTTLKSGTAVVRVDSGDAFAGDRYIQADGTEFAITGELNGTIGEGTAIYLHADGNGRSITNGNRIDAIIDGYEKAVDGHVVENAGSCFINDNHFKLNINNATIAINHRGDSAFRSLFDVQIQPDAASTHAVRNQTTARSVKIQGIIWDPGIYTTASLEGPNIRVQSQFVDLKNMLGTTDNSANQIGFGHGGGKSISLFDFETDTETEISMSNNRTRISVGGTEVLDMDPGAGFLRLKQTTRMLSDFEANGQRIRVVDDGSASSLGLDFVGGAGFYVNNSGEIVAVDESGNESIIT